MPVTKLATYDTTMRSFTHHWTLVNASLAPAALTLAGNYTLANFISDYNAIIAALSQVSLAEQQEEVLKTPRENAKKAVHVRLQQFRGVVTGRLAGTKYPALLPKQPNSLAVESRFVAPYLQMRDVWTEINADTIPGFLTPLTLTGGYALANFSADLDALTAAYRALATAKTQVKDRRVTRDRLLPPAAARMVQYRRLVPAVLPPDSALVQTLPVYKRRPPARTDAPPPAAAEE